jgi:CheY-like chemotaxis protein
MGEALRGGATVLVVDDEPLLRMVVAETLHDAGFTVWEASSSACAIAVLKEHSDIDILISDIKMPGMNGDQVVALGTHHPSQVEGAADDRLCSEAGAEDQHLCGRAGAA